MPHRPRRRGCRVVATEMSARLLLRRQLAALDDVDWTVVSGDPYPDAPAQLEVVVVPMRRELSWSDPASFAALWRLFRRRRFDFVQTHTPKPSILGLPAARLSGTPAIYTIHGSLYFKGNGRLANVLGWCFERWCCTWANRVVVQSREDLERLPKVGICGRRKISYLGNGIELERFTAPVEPAEVAAPEGWASTAAPSRRAGVPLAAAGGPTRGDGRPVVLMVSRLVKEKGCLDFVRLAEALSSRARFVHVGPIEHDQSDSLSDAEMDRARRVVTFVGEVADVRPYLAAADLVVLPSYREGIPRAAMEAAASGRPVAAYDIRGVREVIDPATGLLVARGDVAALTDVVGALIEDRDRLAELGRRCRQRVVEQFGEEAVVERCRALYTELDRRPPTPPVPEPAS